MDRSLIRHHTGAERLGGVVEERTVEKITGRGDDLNGAAADLGPVAVERAFQKPWVALTTDVCRTSADCAAVSEGAIANRRRGILDVDSAAARRVAPGDRDVLEQRFVGLAADADVPGSRALGRHHPVAANNQIEHWLVPLAITIGINQQRIQAGDQADELRRHSV